MSIELQLHVVVLKGNIETRRAHPAISHCSHLLLKCRMATNISQWLKVQSRWFKNYIYLNAKVSQLLLKCYFLLFEPNILLYVIVINKSNDLPSKQHENQTSETYRCRSSSRIVRQPKFEKSQSYKTLHFIESQCYTTLHLFRKGV